MRLRSVVLAITFAGVAFAQEVKMPADFDRLAKVAKECVNVDLDASLLRLGNGFLSDSDKDQAEVKRIISKLRGVYVRSCEFDKPHMYSTADIDSVRSQLAGWSKIVSVESKDEKTWVYLKKKGEAVDGMFVISAEPSELTFVNIEGQIDPKDLSHLGGQMGIPNMGMLHTPRAGGNDKSTSKEDDADELQ